MAQVLRHLPPITDPAVLRSTGDDAAVYLLRDDLAIVQTVDFFTPVVDDPYTFGAIAAANALSDVYAMGAQPKFALNIAGYPKDFPMDVLGRILEGGAAKAAEAGVSVVGGHTVDDREPKYGLCVTGFAHPDAITRKDGLRPGDQLVLTKPLGIGIIVTAIKRGAPAPDAVEEALSSMTTLNRMAAEVMKRHDVRGVTDVTGFGLLGHLGEMLEGSGLSAEIRFSQVPVIEDARRLVKIDVPAGSTVNLANMRACLDIGRGVGELDLLLLADAQTSGGLLMGVSREGVDALVSDLAGDGATLRHAVIGEVTDAGRPGTIRIRA